MRRARPCKHFRRIRTKRGIKRIVVNPKVKKRVKKVRRNYGAGLSHWEIIQKEETPLIYVEQAKQFEEKWDKKREANPSIYPIAGNTEERAKQMWWEDKLHEEEIAEAKHDLITTGDTMVGLKDKEMEALIDELRKEGHDIS